MRIEEIQGYETLATKADVKELRTEIKELRVDMKELRVDVKEQFQRIKLLIWLPVITGLIQIFLAILKH
jgi:hypothetical protein